MIASESTNGSAIAAHSWDREPPPSPVGLEPYHGHLLPSAGATAAGPSDGSKRLGQSGNHASPASSAASGSVADSPALFRSAALRVVEYVLPNPGSDTGQRCNERAGVACGRLPGAANATATPKPPGASELPGPDPLLREFIGFKVRYQDLLKRNVALVWRVTISYQARNGARRQAAGPAELVRANTHPPIPLVISPTAAAAMPRRTLGSGADCPPLAPSRSSTRGDRAVD